MKLFIASVFALAALVLPAVSAAQTDLESTIRAEITKDPRAQNISQAQLDAMVASLAQAAQEQGVTAADIIWQPAEAEQAPAAVMPRANDCAFMCQVNQIFGFGGNDYTIPLGLGISSALLILFMSLMFHRHHTHGVEPTIEAVHTLPHEPVARPKTRARKSAAPAA